MRIGGGSGDGGDGGDGRLAFYIVTRSRWRALSRQMYVVRVWCEVSD